MKLLVLSNGHGEDLIAARVLEQLQQQSAYLELAALPLVGIGNTFTRLNIPLVGTVRSMPSGGFIYMDSRQLWKDMQGGLFGLTLTQWQIVRHWGQKGGKILAVGDIFPLLLAFLSKADYAFIGTAKSEYYLRDENGWLSQTSWFYQLLGSYYFPWERWLMAHPRCKAVFPRDSLTSKLLQQRSISAFDLGNPMMDGLKTEAVGNGAYKVEGTVREPASRTSVPVRRGTADTAPPQDLELEQGIKEKLSILLLPGSRFPEAQRNWQLILQAVEGVINHFSRHHLQFLAAIAPTLSLNTFTDVLLTQGWQPLEKICSPISDPHALAFTKGQKATLILSQQAYLECLAIADVGIAMAGTATEQFVGLGKPAFIIPGQGPQFTPRFAQAQTRLLGCSVILSQPQQVATQMQALLLDTERLQAIAQNGRQRMGLAGAARRIARCLQETLLV